MATVRQVSMQIWHNLYPTFNKTGEKGTEPTFPSTAGVDLIHTFPLCFVTFSFYQYNNTAQNKKAHKKKWMKSQSAGAVNQQQVTYNYTTH